jgi:CO/xanthine dehydrogenase Mo-binding subunit
MIDARQKVTGRLKYTGDLHFPRMLVGKVLYAPAAHGRISSIDTSQAEALPGVHAVATFLNAPDREFNSHITVPFQDVPKNERVFNRHFRFHGDRIAAVAADDERTAREALRLIRLEWEEYPLILTPDAALAEGAFPIHEGGNLADTLEQSCGRAAKTVEPEEAGDTEETAERFEGTFRLPRVTHAALERHISISDFNGETLTVYSSCQNVFCYRAMLAELFDLPFHRMTGRPVKVELSRKEVMCSTRTRTPAEITVSMEIDRSGKFLSHDYRAVLDRGAYFGSAYDLGYALMDKAYRLYRVPHISTRAELIYTNNQVSGAVRGYGNPQISFAREVLIDRICREKDFDPVRFRIDNLVRTGDLNPLNGESLGSCRIIECLETGAERCGWEEKRAASGGTGRIRRGIGLACGVHGSGIHPDCVDYSTASIRMNGDGTLRLNVSAHENGQGCSLVMAKIAAQTLGISEGSVALVETDTAATWFDNGSYASRETWVCGGAVHKAALAVRAQLIREAAAILETSEDAIVQVDGGFRRGHDEEGKVLTHRELVLHAQNSYPYRDVYAVESYASPLDPGAFFANFAEVEVDMELGTVRVLRLTAVHDSGTVINPLLIEGQVDGGMHMGLGYALGEELLTDPESGRQITSSFRSYRMLTAEEMPGADIVFIDGEEPLGPFGAKGIGEATTVAIAPAVANAVTSATGIEISRLPIRIEPENS